MIDTNPYGSRAETLKTKSPHFFANLTLYPTEAGGRANPIFPGFGCPCTLEKTRPFVGFDCWPLLGDEPMYPGETRRVGFYFLVPESAEKIRQAGRFYLKELRFIGEADVVPG